MRRLLTIVAAFAVASIMVYARPQAKVINIALGTATGGTNTQENVRGYVDQIDVSSTGGAVSGPTGQVAVAYDPIDTSMANVNLATNAVADTQVFRPGVDMTDVIGADLTGDPPTRHLLVGDDVDATVVGSPTGVTWKITIKFDDGK